MPSWTTERTRLARHVRDFGPDAPETLAARRDYGVAYIDKEIRRLIAKFPPLTAEQRLRLAELIMRGVE